MDTTHRIATDAVLGLVLLVGLALTAGLLAVSWGGLYWVFDCLAGVAVAAGGLTVVGGTWLTALPDAAGLTAVTVVNAVTWLAAVAVGMVLRAVDRGHVT